MQTQNGATPEPKLLDIRPDLQAGSEPFAKIMATAAALEPGQDLILLVDFEPVPLYQVLGGQGFVHRTERADDGAWKVTFSR